jgi:type II secretory pathway predicted ATPase ExeA/phage tail protein X
MYNHHFGFTAEPFSLTPDPEFLYLSPGHGEALAALKVGLMGKRGLMVMTGEVGTGKTTLLYALLRALREDMRTAFVSNTSLGFDGLLRLALADFAVTPASDARVDMLTALNQLLRECAERELTATLIIDEAQNLDAETFEQLRLLSNFETFTHKLLQIVLVGQPELEVRLRHPALRALAERVAVHCRLAPLGERESRAYLDYRLLRAGGATRLFERDARDVLLAASQGLPRRINILCHNALLFAYGRGAARVTRPVAELAVAGRAALMEGDAPPESARAGSTVTPSPRRIPRLAAALGGVALVAALGVAGLRPAARQSEPKVARELAATTGQVAALTLPATAGESGGAEAVRVADDRLASAPAPAVPVQPAPAPLQPAPAAVQPAPADAAGAAAPAPADADAAAAPAPVESAPPTIDDPAPSADAGPAFRTVRVEAGSSLESLAREVYGGVDSALIKRIQSANPQVVDPNVIMAGDLLRFPTVDPGHAKARKVDAQ